MSTKSAQSAGSKASKRATEVILSASSDSKHKPNSGSKPESLLEGSRRSVSAEKRRLMIAEAAYYISERRGFGGGREMEDWLLAEKQVDAALNGGSAGAQAA